MKKTIGIFHPDFPGGGAERITVDIARYLKNFPGDYDLHVITWHLKEQYLSDDIRNTVEVTVVPEDTHSFREALAELSGRLHFDIFMQVGGPAFPFVREMADRYGTRIIFAHHNETKWAKKMLINTKEERSRESVWKWFKWIAFRKFFYTALGKAERTARKECRMQYDYSDVYTVLCDGYKREFEKWFGLDPEDNKLVVMHNPETEVKDVNLDKKNTIIYVGRLSYPDKRVDRLLRIWKRVQDRLPDYDLKIIGFSNDGYEDELKEYLKGKQHNIEFLGRKKFDEIVPYLKTCLFTVVPSEWYDNFPNVILESFAYKKAVVATDFGSLPELVKDNETGLTFKYADTTDFRVRPKRITAG